MVERSPPAVLTIASSDAAGDGLKFNYLKMTQMSNLKNIEPTIEEIEAYSAAYLNLICNAAIINGVQPVCFFEKRNTCQDVFQFILKGKSLLHKGFDDYCTERQNAPPADQSKKSCLIDSSMYAYTLLRFVEFQ
jgi:hypothetical protein